MGLFDTLYLERGDTRFCCSKCGEIPRSLQTKDLNDLLEDFYIDGDRLMKLHEPRAEFEIKYSAEDLEARKHSIFPSHTGYYPEEAFYPENRSKSSIGDGLPHGWFNAYTSCSHCSTWLEFNLKFTDGKLLEINRGS